MLSYIFNLTETKRNFVNRKIATKTNIKNKNGATLQVRDMIMYLLEYKRVYKSASLSVEAAFALSLYIFAMIVVMLPFKLIDANRKIQAIAESVNKKICEYAYITNYLNDSDSLEKKDEAESEDNFISPGAVPGSLAFSMLLEAKVSADIAAKVGDVAIVDISCSGSEFFAGDDFSKLRINYRYKLPFSVFNLGYFQGSCVSYRRAWIGRELGDAGSESSEDDDSLVYLGRTSGRYHVSRHCHYLYNDIRTVSRANIDLERNSYGAKYHECERCSSESLSSVYIMPSGSKYHSSRNCSAIIAYVRTEKKSNVEHLGACSYCSK